MTKSFTGAIVAILVNRKVIERNAPVERYVPELANTAYRGVTIQQVWNHTTGVHYKRDDENLESDEMRHQQAMGWYPQFGYGSEGNMHDHHMAFFE